MPKKKKAALPHVAAAKVSRRAERKDRKERRNAKLDHRKKERKQYSADQWAVPAPSHLVARLEPLKHKSKYHSYFEFAENTEKKKKKLEFQVTDDSSPQPGFKFVPIGDPLLTNECKEISRELGAMIFIVSASKEENSKISEHIYRTGYHFRETIVDQAREKLGELAISTANGSQKVEPIPESQDEINKQADGAIRDLFPRIPHTDRQMIIEHAFKKGALFHGEPTVGLQPNIPLSRRVQLAVLAHIRHTHTRYDRLLRETTWMNARKAVEPVCLDVLVRWRGDEETGRDQMDEILREVVIITDSEDSDDSSEDEESSDDDSEPTSTSSGAISQPNSRNQMRAVRQQPPTGGIQMATRETNCNEDRSQYPLIHLRPKIQRDKKAQRGFSRYQAAWDQAVRRQEPREAPGSSQLAPPVAINGQRQFHGGSFLYNADYFSPPKASPRSQYADAATDQTRYKDRSLIMSNPKPHYLQQRPMPNEVPVRPLSERPVYHESALNRSGTFSPLNEYRRPPAIERGSLRHGLQDMLVPSIETASSDASGVYEQDSYSRSVAEFRRHSPDVRQIIVIPDDSPQHKRRQIIQDDDFGRSHLLHASSARSRDFLTHRSRVPAPPGQGLFRNGTLPDHLLPVYDSPAESNYFMQSTGYGRKTDEDLDSGRDWPHMLRHNTIPRPRGGSTMRVGLVDRPVSDASMSGRELEMEPRHRSQLQQLPLPNLPAQKRVSHPYAMDPDAVVAGQVFVDSFSQSRAHPVLPKSSFQSQTYNFPGNAPHGHENSATRPYIAAGHEQYRSHVKNMEEHPYYRDDMREHSYQERTQLHSNDREYNEGPQLIQKPAQQHQWKEPIDPRRQIVID